MKRAIADIIRYLRERTVDMDNNQFAILLDELKDEIERLQFLAEWKEPDE